MLELTGKRFIVTGGAGFIGSHTVDLLIDSGAEVLVVDNLASGHLKNLQQHNSNASLQFEEADIAVCGRIAELAQQYQPLAIIHLAALVSVQDSIRDPGLNFERNVKASHEVSEAARKHDVERIVFASSAAVFGDNPNLPLSESSVTAPLSPYGAAKLASECLLAGAARTYGFSVAANRYFNVYGPRQDPASPYSGVMSIFLDRFKSNQPIVVFGDGRQTRDFIFVQDVARMNVLAALADIKGFEAFHICTGRAISLLDLIEEFRKYFPDAPVHKYAPVRNGDIIHSLGCPKKNEEILGFRAQTTLAAGLKLYLEACP